VGENGRNGTYFSGKRERRGKDRGKGEGRVSPQTKKQTSPMTGSNRIYGGIYGQVVQVTGRRVSIALTAWCVHNERTATSRWSCVIRLMNSPVTAAAASRHEQTTAFSYPTIFMRHSRESRQSPTLSPIQSTAPCRPQHDKS